MSGKHSPLVNGIVGMAAAAIAFIIAFQISKGGGSVESKIEKMANQLNKTLPMQTDEFTRWDRVEAGPGKAYSYIYTLSCELTDEQKEAVKQAVTQNVLAAPEMKEIFDAGVTVWYKYYNNSGQLVLEFSVVK